MKVAVKVWEVLCVWLAVCVTLAVTVGLLVCDAVCDGEHDMNGGDMQGPVALPLLSKGLDALQSTPVALTLTTFRLESTNGCEALFAALNSNLVLGGASRGCAGGSTARG